VAVRLAALIAVASISGLVFGGLRIDNAINTSDAYTKTAQLATLGQSVNGLAMALENERDATAGVAAYQTLVSSSADNGASAFITGANQAELGLVTKTLTADQQATDSAAAQVRPLAAAVGSSFPTTIQYDAANVVTMIDSLAGTHGLRERIKGQTAALAITEYSAAIGKLFLLNDQMTEGIGDALLAQQVRMLGALSQAKDQTSQQQAILYAALIEASGYNNGTAANPANTLPKNQPLNDAGGLGALTGAEGIELADLAAFSDSETADLPPIEVAVSPWVDNQIIETLVTANGNPAAAFAPTSGYFRTTLSRNHVGVADLWNGEMASEIEAGSAPTGGPGNTLHGIETKAMSDILARSQLLQHDAANSALLTAAITVGAVLLVLLATLLVARSLVNPLRRLRADALDIAAVRLPERVAAAAAGSETDAETAPIEPVGVSSTDEIGQVARAFDQVHAEAVRLAGNEAQLRGSLSAMFISLSRRSVPLIDRLARMIDGMEQSEDDPDQLGNLFAMDHLVTRMRRNSENLLVLAGEEPVRKWTESVPLADVVRAAAAEIEQYSRVALTVQPGVMVSGQAAADVVHLLAELIENATLFSPQSSQVRVTVMELSTGGVLVEVRDDGVGVSQARMTDMNWRLEHPPALDVSVSRHMGLYAVAHLASRHGIRVKLRPGTPQGLSALVWLPGSLARHERAAAPSHSRPVAAPAQAAGQVTAGRPPTMTRREATRRPGGGSAEQPRLRDRGSRSGKSTAWFAAKRPSDGSNGAVQQFTSDWQPATGGRVPGVGPAPTGYEPAKADPLNGLTAERTTAGLPRRTPLTGSYPGADSPGSHLGAEAPGYGLADQGASLLGAPAGGSSSPPPTSHQESAYPGYQETSSYPAGKHQAVSHQETQYQEAPYQEAPYQETQYRETPYQEAPYQEAQYREAPLPELPAPGQLPVRRRSPEAVRDRLTGFQLGSRDAEPGGSPSARTEALPAAPRPPETTPPGQLPVRRRSPEAVRDRLTGFQLGSRDATQPGTEPRQAPPAGEENGR
jgi:signal transduction histidine kinase